MKFVKFTEYNDWEGETWNFWLQYDGNEEALKSLFEFIEYIDWYGDFYKLDLDNLVDESEVDVLVKHSDCGYMGFENKVNGLLNFSLISKIVNETKKENSDEERVKEKLRNLFYKGDITDFFNKRTKYLKEK